jgi:hypothetical protein
MVFSGAALSRWQEAVEDDDGNAVRVVYAVKLQDADTFYMPSARSRRAEVKPERQE